MWNDRDIYSQASMEFQRKQEETSWVADVHPARCWSSVLIRRGRRNEHAQEYKLREYVTASYA